MLSTLYALIAAKKTFHKLSSEIDVFYCDRLYTFCTLFVFQQSYFIGISRSTGDEPFVYSDFTSLIKFEAWGAQEPNNKDGNEFCVVLNDKEGKWFDVNCNDTMKFICEHTGKH